MQKITSGRGTYFHHKTRKKVGFSGIEALGSWSWSGLPDWATRISATLTCCWRFFDEKSGNPRPDVEVGGPDARKTKERERERDRAGSGNSTLGNQRCRKQTGGGGGGGTEVLQHTRVYSSTSSQEASARLCVGLHKPVVELENNSPNGFWHRTHWSRVRNV